MIADLKPYAEYKPSSQAWLGDIPQHWSVLPNRALFGEVKDRDHPDEEMLSVTITRGIVRQKALLEGSSKKDSSNLDKSAYKLVQPRDIAYNKMRAWQGAIGASGLRGIISPAYVVMRLRRDDDLPSYFHHLYRTPQFAKEAERWSYGITSDMWSLRPEHFKMIYTPKPPPAEQVAIVRFLDWATGRLERAIRAKRKVIALLNEQKQAIIHRAVTSGLNPSVPLKPSGIPWLGDIPQHWEVTRLYRVTDPARKIMYGIVLPGPDVDRGVYIVKGGNCEEGRLRPEFLSRTTVEIESGYARSRLRGSDIVYAIRGSIGAAQIVPDELAGANVTQDAARIAPGPGIHPQWLLFAVRSRSFFNKLEAGAVGATIRGINIRDLKRTDLVVPPSEEQEQIATYLLEETAQVNAAISRLEREIELLHEYRTRLVADVVTGKFDVREVAARLQEEPAEPEVLGVIDAAAADERDTADEAEKAMTADSGD